ncbi:MAG: branched-chain amino acid transporter AzlC [Lachnospiraceae bacterium]|jgi:predicted branched-subunit amino acid permease|nr:branched-chain amino acid transporter AzlC [Lachnospiraceae bacterium]MCI8957930.1 branched-chain amino acid transporter AzlC [Lachnospiraceae bacterium]
MKTKALKAALPHTLPICVGFLFLGMSYGFLMKSLGFPFFYPMFMSLFIFAGSMELVTVSLLLSAFNPFYAFFLALLNQAYWVTGAALGALLGYVIRFDTTGIEFGMTALFVVMFLSQWEEHKDHRPALTGLGCSLASLALLGPDAFILPAMALIILFLSLTRLKSRRTEAV